MSSENGSVIRLTEISKYFKKQVAVSNLSLTVRRGDIFGFLGPNGAGKSTTIRIILDLIRPTKGEVEVFGLPLKSNRTPILKQVGALVENPDFYKYLSGRKNLQLFGKMLGGVKSSQIDSLLDLVQLKERGRDKVKSYSHGMKQRLGIAQTLLGQPKLVILDEPTTGLDPQGMKEVRDLIVRLADQDITVFLSSHLLHEIEQICTRMAIINKGELVVEGSVDELLNQKAMMVSVEVDRIAEAIECMSRLDFVQRVMKDSRFLKVELPYKEIPHLNRILVEQNIRVYRLVPQTTLEDFYLSLVQNNG